MISSLKIVWMLICFGVAFIMFKLPAWEERKRKEHEALINSLANELHKGK